MGRNLLRFSIITCVKNGENFIERCISSVDALIHEDYEHLVVDGESTDKTLKIINEHSNSRRSIICQPDTGLYNALNEAIKLAIGEYVILLHADDEFPSSIILNELEEYLFEKGFPDIVFCDISMKNLKGETIREWKAAKFQWLGIKNGWCPPHTGLVLKRRIYNINLPYSEQYSISSDYDFMVRLLSKGYKYTFFKKILVVMYIGGMSTSIKNYGLTFFEDMKISKANRLSILAPFFKRFIKIGQFF